MAGKTKIRASQVNEDTLQDADNNTKITVEKSANENKIRFDTAGTERMIIDETGKVGVGVASPASTLHVQGNLNGSYVATFDNDENNSGHVLKLNTDGTGNNTRVLEMETGGGDIIFRARADGRFGFGPDGVDSMGAGTFVVGIDNSSHTSDIAISRRLQHLGDGDTYLDFPSNDSMVLTSGGNDAVSIDSTGHVKFNQGIKYARGVLVSSGDSPAEVGGWIKFATHECPGTSNLDTAASSFLVTFAGMESSNNRAIDGTFMVHAKFTVNTGGNADGGSNYYEAEGTKIYCEPLNADVLSATGANDFDPATDLIMITTNTDSTPTVDLYIKANAKDKHCFVTHLGGTGQTQTFDTDPGWTINTGQSWTTTEPAAPAGSAKITGTWSSKVFSKLDVYGDTTIGGKIGIMVESNTPSQPQDGEGYLYSKSDGKLYWRSHDIAEVDLTAAGGGGGSGDIAENVITGSSNLSLTSSHNRDTIIITPLSADVTYTLPDPTANFKVKFLAGANCTGGDVIFKAKQSSQKIFGMIYRVSYGGDSETGWDNSPTSYAGDTAAKFVGGASEEHKNTITLVNALQGSDIDFYSDGTYWYVRGSIVAVGAGNALAATTTFSYESY